ncbi:hypothetical protein F5Y03DRAFT_34996 [Xylaria venustula]|nr:hypothetical protein F5Y03DRAFT_34996 [Xylaria venustula]
MNVLCEGCQRIFDAAHECFACIGGDKRGSFIPISTWKSNVETRSCHLCSILFSTVKWDRIDRLLEMGYADQPQFGVRYRGRSPLSVTFFFSRTLDGLEEPVRTYEVLFRPLKDIDRGSQGDDGHGQLTNGMTWSRTSVQLVEKSLRECSSSHSICKTDVSPEQLPLRLVDVEPASETQAPLGNEDIDLLSVERRPKVRVLSTSSLPLDTPI